uniref:Uncharacterized protein n=1 Tax=Plectus sambesii TaxID=2011161 RepID=A0A914WAD9_9BILA
MGMKTDGRFDDGNETHLFASSTVGCTVAEVMVQRCVAAWNNHSVQKRGKPLDYIATKANFPLPMGALPSVVDAAKLYRDKGYHLTDEWSFGKDPLEGQGDKQASRNQSFWLEVETMFGGAQGLANEVAQHHYANFQWSILRFCELSEQ